MVKVSAKRTKDEGGSGGVVRGTSTTEKRREKKKVNSTSGLAGAAAVVGKNLDCEWSSKDSVRAVIARAISNRSPATAAPVWSDDDDDDEERNGTRVEETEDECTVKKSTWHNADSSDAAPNEGGDGLRYEEDRDDEYETEEEEEEEKDDLLAGWLAALREGRAEQQQQQHDGAKAAAAAAAAAAVEKEQRKRRKSTPSKRSKSRQKEKQSKVPVYVMLPLDVVRPDGRLNERHRQALPYALEALSRSGVDGVMVDFWWGIIERDGPRQYDWYAFAHILKMAKRVRLKLSVVLSFHSCGNNVGDDDAEFEVPLPPWVLEAAKADPDLLYTDKNGNRNPECLSLWADCAPLADRTVLQCYADFMEAFRSRFQHELGSTITEITVGCGPCGELRYPSYPQGNNQWRFPGIGEFQCFDRNALGSLAHAAAKNGHIEWGGTGPHDAGTYNCLPHDTGFFCANGSWASDYGRFFLTWYSDELIAHGDRMLSVASEVFGPGSSSSSRGGTQGNDGGGNGVGVNREKSGGVTFGQVWHRLTGNIGGEMPHSSRSGGAGAAPRERAVQISLKCAGVHWWFLSRSHAAELTAGYYNTHDRDGYDAIASLCARHDARLNFTCMEMRNSEHPEHAMCGPEGLLLQVREAAARHGTPFVGENALTRFDRYAYDRIIENVYFDRDLPPMAGFTFLRLAPRLLRDSNLTEFVRFVAGMENAARTLEARKKKEEAEQQQLLLQVDDEDAEEGQEEGNFDDDDNRHDEEDAVAATKGKGREGRKHVRDWVL